jgi:hypothetical protein
VRFLSLVFLICSACDLNAQCPILLRQASVEAHGKEVTIRYYNSDARVVQAVEFVETRGVAALALRTYSLTTAREKESI